MNYFEDGNGGLYYGMQGMDADGNAAENYLTDIIVDYDEEYTSFVQKGDIGDVEIFRCGGSTMGNRASIAGDIRTEKDDMVMQVEMSLMSNLPEYPLSKMIDGMYVFDELPMNVSYELTAEKTGDWLNGVSTLDLVKIQRHILGLEMLDSPYKVIAADINGDESLKASDLTQLRKLILGVISELPNNTSWRFVDAAQEFAEIHNPWPIDESIETGMLTTSLSGQDMIAVKIGDVSGNAVPNATNGIGSEVRSNKAIEWEVEDREMLEGELVEVVMKSMEATNLYGYQFTIETEGMSYVGVKEGIAKMSEVHVGVLKGDVITVSYHDAAAMKVGKGDEVFTLIFRVDRGGKMSDKLVVSGSVTPNEAYVDGLEMREINVVMGRGTETVVAENAMYQNEPNPFKDQTTIKIDLVEAGEMTMTIKDVTGKVIKEIVTEGVKGTNYMTLDASDLGASGVKYYTVKSGSFTDTKQMIMVR